MSFSGRNASRDCGSSFEESSAGQAIGRSKRANVSPRPRATNLTCIRYATLRVRHRNRE